MRTVCSWHPDRELRDRHHPGDAGQRALERAALLVAPQARVCGTAPSARRTRGVVDGDLVNLRPGDQVWPTASGASVGLMLDESPLTGESLPWRGRGRSPAVRFVLVEGSGGYFVTGTGPESYAWQLLGTARENTAQRSPLEQQVNQLLRLLVAVMVPLGRLGVRPGGHDTPFREAVATATAGIVTMIPEGLVLLMSLTFAVGAVRLSRKGMLVQYMNAIESLANVDTVCLDKTGTLTDGNLALHSVVPRAAPGARRPHPRLRLRGQRRVPQLHPGRRRRRPAGRAASPLEEVPFSSRWKWSGIRREVGWLVLGAPDVLRAGRLPAEVSGHEQEGRRVLAFGRADQVVSPADGGGGTARIEPLAMVVLEERLRDDAADTIAFLYRQDVDVKVMSGDSPVTVAAVAARAGIRVSGAPRQGPICPRIRRSWRWLRARRRCSRGSPLTTSVP